MTRKDHFDLERFVEAQDPVFDRVMEELRAGSKRSHWMWFVFPQIQGLGHSTMAERYAISSVTEARAYLHHDVLGPRLRGCVEALQLHAEKSALQILGHPDDLKLRSSLTLFAGLEPEGSVFHQALDRFFEAKPDERTLQRMRSVH
ncbi:hypothetical protein PS627_00637 [Pseudomonas fluorescens]|uniref:DUF1810 domain-containing protein n=1 Tax=Pseudomonas fluorescens TaxID=294 RepID=UPI00125C67A9|nr:DUF1810 domain-containing protein [Pseudomonas fluorescens]CAG8863699.1 hypothetical protein PS627_00637 [Pseudomonas fluorescens]VVP70434.1 hypothetical protein PS910_00765 [Pseudomonas fluorescens]